MTPLTDQTLARLYAHLEVPVAVQDLLSSNTPMDHDAALALQDLIGSQTPDRALLGLAIASIILHSRMRDEGLRMAEVLSLSAEMMVQDYAPAYLSQQIKAPGTTLFDGDDPDLYLTVSEDLESLSDLLEVVGQVLPDDAALFKDMARILSAQAGAQALMAQTVLDALGLGDIDDGGDDFMSRDEGRYIILSSSLPNDEKNAPDNVVPFPRRS
jgi:hypothetical protein